MIIFPLTALLPGAKLQKTVRQCILGLSLARKNVEPFNFIFGKFVTLMKTNRLTGAVNIVCNGILRKLCSYGTCGDGDSFCLYREYMINMLRIFEKCIHYRVLINDIGPGTVFQRSNQFPVKDTAEVPVLISANWSTLPDGPWDVEVEFLKGHNFSGLYNIVFMAKLIRAGKFGPDQMMGKYICETILMAIVVNYCWTDEIMPWMKLFTAESEEPRQPLENWVKIITGCR